MRRLVQHIAKRDTSSRNVMVHIATAAVAVSIAVALISLSVIFGFKEQISTLVTGLTSDITISDPRAKRQPEQHPIYESEALQHIVASTPIISHSERFALCNGIVRGEDGAVGIVIRGVGAEADLSLFAERLSNGSMPRFDEARRKEILLSQALASKIGAAKDSRIEIVLMDGEIPRRELFKVCGVYNSVFGEDGSALAITDIRNVQKLNGWEPSQISGYACRLYDPEFSERAAEIVNMRLMYEYEGEESLTAISAREEHALIFGWLETHDVNATVILTIMLIVAVFNVITALLILVLERTRMVGVLKSLGMQNRTLQRIFTHHAARIIVRGAVIGNVIALTLLLIQKHLHLVKLDESGYFLSEIPVTLGVGWIIATNILFIAIILGITYLATSIVGRIKVAEAIKYN